MVAQNTTTGAVAEYTILPYLKRNGYKVETQAYVGTNPNGREYRVDALSVTPDNKEILVSLKWKWRQVSGIVEEKIPYEVITLIRLIENSEGRFNKAYLVLVGDGWTLKDWYISGKLKDYVMKSHLVDIISLDTFISWANRKKL